MRLNRICLGLTLTALLAACSTTTTQKTGQPVRPGEVKLSLKAVDYSQLPLVADENWQPALVAFKESCKKMGKQDVWQDVCTKAQYVPLTQAKTFFAAYFTPYQVFSESTDEDGNPMISDTGKMTGYYEPILYGSRHKKTPYLYPLHTIPDDLITVDLAEVYPQLKGMRLRGQLQGNRLVPYFSRAQLAKRNLDKYAIAWVEDPVAAFFLQVQGSGRIVLPDGKYMRVGYGDVNGYPYQGIGNYLVRHGYLKSHELSMQSIQAWAKQNPRKIQEVLNQNPSYVFFIERTDQNPNEGPIGAQGVPLTEKGSVAVDRRYYQLGWPIVVDVEQTSPDMKFTRAVVAQDTGGAIRGPIRFDFYWGSGDEAALAAGKQNSRVKAWVLLPNGAEPPV